METANDYNSARKKTVTTYGKFAKRRAVPASNVSASAYDFPADDDELISAPRFTTSSSSEPSRRPSPSRTFTRVSAPGRIQQPSKALGASVARKRKLQHVSPAKPPVPAALVAPVRTKSAAAGVKDANSRNRRVLSAQSSDSSELEHYQSKPSTASPPQTPTPPMTSNAKKRRFVAQDVPFSPNTMQVWDQLGRDASPNPEPKSSHHQIPVRLADSAAHTLSLQAAIHGSNSLENSIQPTAVVKQSPVSNRRTKKRLIDTLAEQSTGADDDDEQNSDDANERAPMIDIRPQLSSQSSYSSSSQNTGMPPATPMAKPKATPASQVRTFARSSSALKFQYGQQNKILEEEVDLYESLDIPGESSAPLKGRRLELGNHKKKSNDPLGLEDEDLDTNSSKRMIRNIHELRQAGADSRDADEMADLSYQIGVAGQATSSRRAALIQVAEQLHDKSFVRKYRAHGLEQTIFRGIEHEEDTIAACLIASILVIVLAKERSAHTVQVLLDENPVAMLVRLLPHTQTLKELVRDRKSNLSKRNQTAILDIQNAIAQPAVWKTQPPKRVSPCTLGLKALRCLVAPGDDLASHASMLPASTTQALFAVVERIVDELKTSEEPDEVDTTDLEIAVSILHDHAAYISTVAEDDNQWASAHLPVVADLFGATLGKPDKALEKVALKLTINMVNHNLAAPDIFVSRGLVEPLAISLCSKFHKALELATENRPTDGLLDGLVLELGILINFCEDSPLARKTTFESGYGDDAPIDQIIRLFLDNRRKTSEADSVEKSQLNVVFGYLTILLGYLALYPPVRDKFRKSHPGKNMQPLLESIREFMLLHKKMESLSGGDEDEESSKNTEWQSLQKLAYSIEDAAAQD